MIDLESKQKVWANQLPLFKENYILTSDLDLLEFDMINGQFVIKPNQGNDGFDDEDSLVLYHSVNTAWAMWLRCNRLNQAEIEALKAQLAKVESGEFVVVPKEPTDAIKTALSYQCFDLIKVAQIYRDHGFDIPKKAEDEQSFFLHKFLILAVKHGNNFVKVFNDETKAMIEAAQENSHE